MTDELLEELTARLQHRLQLPDPDEDQLALLQENLVDAEAEILLYLGQPDLVRPLIPKVIDLAVIYFQRDHTQLGLKSTSYSEGSLSQADTFLSPQEYRAAVLEVLDGLARYRIVSC